MKDVLFIGAGTNGAKRIGNSFQPYKKIHGKTCIEYVFDAACNSQAVERLYIWGNKRRLEKLLKDKIDAASQKNVDVIIIEERETPFDSFFFAYLNYISDNSLKEIVSSWKVFEDVDWNTVLKYARDKGLLEKQIPVILSDTPLITPREIDFMLSNMDESLDIIFGRTLQDSFEKVLAGTKEKFVLHLAVKNFYNYIVKKREVGLIVNSFFAGKPLKIDRRIWDILVKFYENRTIIEGRRFNWRKIKNNYHYIKRFLFSRPVESSEKRSSVMKTNWFLLKSYMSIIRNSKSDKMYRDLSVLFSRIEDAIGLKISYQISRCVGAAFDIDTCYEAEFIENNYQTLVKNIQNISL
jgi:2-phospho-L-lactate guanylyltransferase (CobY/MobA/RfbA family)